MKPKGFMKTREAFQDPMTRKLSATALTMLLLLTALFAAAGAAGVTDGVATPTDLDCAHEHTHTIVYFYDGPVYTSISGASHRVSGPATVETVCEDCGEILASEYVAEAEEIRPHSMRNGVCALCGYRSPARPSASARTDAPGEKTFFAVANEEELLTLTLSNEDLIALNNARITTALIRGEAGEAAIALDVKETLQQLKNTEADLYMEMAEREDGSLFAGLFLVSGEERQTAPEETGITLRFYQPAPTPIRVSLAPVDRDTLLEAETTWNEKGFWSVPYTEEGTYFLLH